MSVVAAKELDMKKEDFIRFYNEEKKKIENMTIVELNNRLLELIDSKDKVRAERLAVEGKLRGKV